MSIPQGMLAALTPDHACAPRRTPSNTTRTCNKLLGVYMWTGEAVMDLDRGLLARLDRKLLASFGQDETYQMARVPVSASKWSTWRRYWESVGVSMGRAIATLIDDGLASVLDDSSGMARRLNEEDS